MTRARTSTRSTASKRPVNSVHSTSFSTRGCATVTSGGGGAALALAWLSRAGIAAGERQRGQQAEARPRLVPRIHPLHGVSPDAAPVAAPLGADRAAPP